MATLLTHTTSLPIEEAKYRVPFSLGQPHYPGKTQPYPSCLPTKHWTQEYKEQTPEWALFLRHQGWCAPVLLLCVNPDALPTHPAFLWRGGASLTQGPQE